MLRRIAEGRDRFEPIPSLTHENIGDMSTGSVEEAAKNHWLVSGALIGVIILCGVLLGLADLNKPWTVAVQVVTAISGAALGSTIRLDTSRQAVNNQARPATRHLFDQAIRLRELVQRAESYEASIAELASADDMTLDPNRTADWFGVLGSSLRAEILATATAIDNWDDLAPAVIKNELSNYKSREERLPTTQKGPSKT